LRLRASQNELWKKLVEARNRHSREGWNDAVSGLYLQVTPFSVNHESIDALRRTHTGCAPYALNFVMAVQTGNAN
jgi:hypothetical protein